jgi:hypothetical protein
MSNGFKQEIRDRMAGGGIEGGGEVQGVAFRGGRYGDVIQELRSGRKRGRDVTVHTVPESELVSFLGQKPAIGFINSRSLARDMSAAGLETLSDYRESPIPVQTETNPVVGGISRFLSVSVRFASSTVLDIDDVPLVYVLDRGDVGTDILDIEYTETWRDDHKHIAGAVDRGGEMLSVSADAGLDAYFDVAGSDKEVRYRDNPLGSFTKLKAERESAAVAESINLRGSVMAVGAYLLPERSVELLVAETELPRQQAEELDQQDRHTRVWDLLRDSIPAYIPELTVVESVVSFTTGEPSQTLDPGKFIGAYNGETHTTNPTDTIFMDASQMVGGSP